MQKERATIASRGRRALALVVSLCAVQFILYGPSLLGQKLLLPLDCLVGPYLSESPTGRQPVVQNRFLIDAVLQVEPDRVYAAEQIRRGRIPLWNPYNYCGVPFLANNNSAVFSPFVALSYLWPGPEVLAWTQLLKALVAGIGAYVYFRRVSEIGFWAALVGANCFPLIGFMVLLTWIHHSSVVAWLPWMLVATHAAVYQSLRFSGPILAIVTCLTLLSGKLDTSAFVLLASGLYGTWCLVERFRFHAFVSRNGLISLVSLIGGWSIGFALSAPVGLPTYEYLQTSDRVDSRQTGHVDFPGEGVAAVPQLVLPFIYGSNETESTYLLEGYHSESAAAGYAGFIMAMVLVPLGCVSGKRKFLACWALIGLFAFAPHLRIPLISDLFLLPPFHLFQNNRFIFVTAWSILAMGTIGLDTLREQDVAWHRPFWIAVVGLMGVAVWYAAHAWSLPARLSERISDSEHGWFQHMYAESAVVCLIAAVMWIIVWWTKRMPIAAARIVGLIVVAELVYNAFGVMPQCDRSLYYPELPAIQSLRHATPGRICGWGKTLPASLNRMFGLRGIDGYDGADPRHLVKLLKLANPGWTKSPSWVVTRNFEPWPSPILDMLHLRYVIFRGQPPPDAPVWKSTDLYWVMKNETCLPRPYVPRRVEVVANQEDAFQRMERADFSPADVAYVEEPKFKPRKDVSGAATIIEEAPGEITLRTEMATPGIVVISDLYFPGWRATINGSPENVLRVNGALMGVKVPRGASVVKLEYRPLSFRRGLWIALFGAIVLSIWVVAALVTPLQRATR